MCVFVCISEKFIQFNEVSTSTFGSNESVQSLFLVTELLFKVREKEMACFSRIEGSAAPI